VLNLAVFVSGNGSNFRAIDASIREGRLGASIRLVVSSSDKAGALCYAAEAGYPVLVESRDDRARDGYGARLLASLSEHGVDFVALCGYLLLVPAEVVRAFPNRMVNIHPALLPAFGGKGMYGHYVHEAVLASGARYSGATVHIVTEEYDRGPIVAQRAVPVEDADTPASLAARVLAAEHEIYTEALQLFAAGRVAVRGLRTSHLA
jgi:formyltetrahydrofolate-dependent phosphoribosylglycinamide formyltransferase